ncbi:MAG: bacteriochlorophyll a protein [Rhizobacter sp.]|nr:bacteriochlorophyll a protein [Chlorobiales bacterium]
MALFGSAEATIARSDYDITLEGGTSTWGKLKARATINVTPAVPLLPCDCNIKIKSKPIGDSNDVARLSILLEAVVDSTVKKLTVEVDIANESDERRVSVGDGVVTVGDFSHAFSFEGSVVNLQYYKSDVIRRNIPNPRYVQGRQFHDILMKIPLENEDLIQTWELTLSGIRNSGPNFGDWVRDFWFIGPARNALDEGGQRISNLEVVSIGTEGTAEQPLGVSNWRFSNAGSGVVEALSRWLELFPVDKLLRREASIEGGFRSDSQGIEVKVDGELPGLSIDAGGGLRRILNHPLIPLIHHGIIGKYNDFRVDSQLTLTLPKGYKIRSSAPQYRTQNQETYKWYGGSYAKWVEHVCKGGTGQFEILYAQ